MSTIHHFKGEDPHLLIALDQLKPDVWPCYVTAGFSTPAVSDPEEAEVYTPLEAVTAIRHTPGSKLAAIPYAVAVYIQGLREELRASQEEIASLRSLIDEAQIEDVDGNVVKFTVETIDAEAHEGGGTAAWLTLPEGYVVVPEAIWEGIQADPPADWRSMDDLPKFGKVLVLLPGKSGDPLNVQVMRIGKPANLIGQHFAWDLPKPLGWIPLKVPPVPAATEETAT